MNRVFVAMSGGVDSSVAATLLQRKGYDVTGVFMRPWQPDLGTKCLWQEDREDAMRVATKISIPLLTWDFSKEYKKYVTKYMLKEYKAGRTPNPDIMCNKEIKFGLFLKKALKEGASHIATGHYVKLRKGSLYKAKDLNKDQSYFLWTLTQKQLKYCLFPIGNYTKPEVRKLAKKFDLPNQSKKDSQGVCFIGPLNMKEFLKKYIKPKKGNIILNNKIVGEHDGSFYYTIGQRHGLDMGGAGPYYIISKDIKKNEVFVGTKNDLNMKEFSITNPSGILYRSDRYKEVEVRTRYRAPLIKVASIILVRPPYGGLTKIILKKPDCAITAGQSAVFYKGKQMLGGGIIL
jgi:tRNA-uridine 2-sulfurtransferase